MKIILSEDIKNVGTRGQIMTVADGYARNFLLPRGLARLATPAALRMHEHENQVRRMRSDKEKRHALKVAQDLEKMSVSIKVQTGEEDKLFGSVTAAMIADALKAEHKVEVDRRHIDLEEPIKELGVYTLTVKLHADVSGKIKVWVVKDSPTA